MWIREEYEWTAVCGLVKANKLLGKKVNMIKNEVKNRWVSFGVLPNTKILDLKVAWSRSQEHVMTCLGFIKLRWAEESVNLKNSLLLWLLCFTFWQYVFEFNDTLWKVPEVILKSFSFLLSRIVCYAQLEFSLRI